VTELERIEGRLVDELAAAVYVATRNPVGSGAVDVWIAAGLRRPWRVVSESRTYGEWDDRGDAERFLELLVEGNSHLRRLV
jgi:hypothetical protein